MVPGDAQLPDDFSDQPHANIFALVHGNWNNLSCFEMTHSGMPSSSETQSP